MDVIKTPTPIKPNPIPPGPQLTFTLYCLAHDCSFSTPEEVFGWPISTKDQTFIHVCRILVQRLQDRYVKLANTVEEWRAEVRGFLENLEFPCVGASDGFHVYISSKLKKYFSYEKRYSISNMGLVGFNKRFLYAIVVASSSAHDARLLRQHLYLKLF